MTVLHKPDPVSSLLGSACQRVDVEWKRVRGMAGIQMKNKEAVAENSGRQGRKRRKGWRPDRGRQEDGNNVKERYTVWKSGYPNTVYRGTGMQSQTASLFTPAWAFQQLSVSKLSYLNRGNSRAAASWKWSAWTGEDPDFSGGSKCFWLRFIYN